MEKIHVMLEMMVNVYLHYQLVKFQEQNYVG